MEMPLMVELLTLDLNQKEGDRSNVPSSMPDDRGGGIFLSQYCLVYARHGTHAPTKEKLKELNDLAMRMEVLLQDAKEQKLALQKSSCLVSGMEISLAREAQGW
ncbi:hypothetical protein LOK49_LG10G02905 [Camellia lanceoleosa]|uniref:Uncharacterized protein n=1 Tax=Camellia lanceoleosa TaxID=1840588 RepID=A0ACC0G755_9ERIC|nr:hypothetical protein LOK49_LG10G02905 [Camellia lanceoleosa]